MLSLRNYQYFGGHSSQNKVEDRKRELPNVDVTLFNESAVAFKHLMRDASTVLDRLADHKDFASEVMAAAQGSDTAKVEHLIESTGIKSIVEPTFNPDGLTMVFHAKVQDTDCCKLTMTLRW
ncbi:hypothetical protein ACOI1C_05375 [Bacillus sp. DJP31]|uniref:hypothetical protein n=1 Tax=Bacillus sp. DJP31 TaxID=3409789 RepID=UPI003BB492C4